MHLKKLTISLSLLELQSNICCPLGISSIKDHRNFKLINSPRCGIDSKERVENGNKTGLFEHKWNVLLQFQSSLGDEQLKFMCGGSLIAGD